MKNLIIVGMLFLTGLVSCNTSSIPKPPTYPNQINAFDASAYTSLKIAQSALNEAKIQIVKFPQYKAQLNSVIAGYNTTLAAYKTWHSTTPTPDFNTLSAQLNDFMKQLNSLLASLGVKL